jgi:hypothetical protein
MTKSEFAKFAAALRTYYPRETMLLPNHQAAELWYHQLKDIDYKVAELTLNKWVALNKWSPSIAEIRENAMEISLGPMKSWSDAWEEVKEAMRKYGRYEAEKAMSSLDDITRETVRRLGFNRLCESTNQVADRANFRDIYTEIAEDNRKNRQLPDVIRLAIEENQTKRIGEKDENIRRDSE